MDEPVALGRGHARGRGRSLVISGTWLPIVSEDASSCLIAPPDGFRARGYADIYDGERHRAHCLVVLAQREGAYLRIVYKRRTTARAEPPADFVAGEPVAPPALDVPLVGPEAGSRPGRTAQAWTRSIARLARRGLPLANAD